MPENEIFFLTFKTHRLYDGTHQILSDEEKQIVLENVKIGSGKYYVLIAVVVLSNHVHFMMFYDAKYKFSRIMRGIKSKTARLINISRKVKDVSVWQNESFDRVIRNEAEFNEKLRYMYENPTKEGYQGDPIGFKYFYLNEKYEEEIK